MLHLYTGWYNTTADGSKQGSLRYLQSSGRSSADIKGHLDIADTLIAVGAKVDLAMHVSFKVANILQPVLFCSHQKKFYVLFLHMNIW